MSENDRRSLEQMAKNLLKCSDRTINDVFLHLEPQKKDFLVEKMKELRLADSNQR